jgi:hypothetical protein
MKVRIVCANSTENIETATSGHLQIENEGVRLHFLDAPYRFRHVACLSHKLRSGYLLLQQIGQAFHDYPRIIGDKDFHLFPFREPSAHVQSMTNLPGNTSGGNRNLS